MKKNITAVLGAALAVLALPAALAFGATVSESVITDTAASNNGINATVTATDAGGATLSIEPTDQQASNVPAGTEILASFKIEGNDAAKGPFKFTYNLGADYAGAAVTVYVDHEGKADNEVINETAGPDGSVSFTTQTLSIHSIAATKATGTKNVDTGAKSPATGLNSASIAAVTAVAAIAAAGVALSLRKNSFK